MPISVLKTALSGLLLLLASFTITAQEIVSEHVDIHAFSELLIQADDNPDFVIVDVRTPEEFHTAHIANAVVVDFYAQDFIANLKQLDKTKTYLLYCRSGNRSGKTLNIMRKMGFQAAYNMKGGMKAWTAARYPVVR